MLGRLGALSVLVLLTACTNSIASEATDEGTREAASEQALVSIPADQRAFLGACEPWDEWDKPGPPFEIYRDTYHVGTCGISAILITDDSGHILIDSGTEGGADVVMANIATLGFDIKDVRFLLSSHEHFDHVGGMAKLQRASGAVVVASRAAAPALRTGQAVAEDPQYGMHDPFEAMSVGRIIAHGETVTIGDTSVRAIETPGHSPGALSWAWQECKERCENIVYADSLSPVSRDDYKFAAHPDYLARYRAGLKALSQEDCQIVLAPHPSHARMLRRMAEGQLIQNAPRAKPCKDYAEGKLQDIDKRLAKEAASE